MRYLLLCLLLSPTLLRAAAPENTPPGHKIKIKLENYPEKSLVFGFYYGEKPYVKDTLVLGGDGYFSIEADTMLPAGMYLLVLTGTQDLIQLILPENDQEFTLNADALALQEKLRFKGSDDNARFYDYMGFLRTLRPEADTLRAQLGRLKNNKPDSTKIANRLDELDQKVQKQRRDFLKKYPMSAAAKLVRASTDPEAPDFQGDEATKNRRARDWWHAHFFDNLDLGDPFSLRNSMIHGKIEFYLHQFTVQHPDSVNRALDFLLEKMRPAPETYRYYLNHFLNYYAQPKYVGFDACYVHLANRYVCKEKPGWIKKESLERICDDARRMEPVLIGKIAPNLMLRGPKNEPVNLYDVDADYTVAFFWRPDCGHCKTAAPHIAEFARNFKDRGVKVFTICTPEKEGTDCWKAVEEKGFNDLLFINASDPYVRRALYNIQKTPQIFILDRKHKILMKDVKAEELGRLMEQIIKEKGD
jgi:alkyl hydroperoxide reductase subunit AhpC